MYLYRKVKCMHTYGVCVCVRVCVCVCVCMCLPPFFVYISGLLLTMDAAPMPNSDIASDEL